MSPPGALDTPGSERLADRLADFMVRARPTGDILFVSPPGAGWLGDDGPTRGGNLLDWLIPEDRAALATALAAVDAHGRLALQARFRHADGTHRAATIRILGLAAVTGHEECLVAAWSVESVNIEGPEPASPDSLTGLPGRAGLLNLLARLARPRAQGGAGPFALIHMDLDGFQKVNDALGHALGDQLLREAAARLTALLRGSDTVARTGSDEFALVLPGPQSPETIPPIARKILAAMQRPFLLEGHPLHLSATLGIALYPDHAEDDRQLFRCADVALNAAKAEGRNHWRLYQRDGAVEAVQGVALEEHMYDAIQNGEFEMHFQPIWRASSREIVGMEALMRWNRPGEGAISPARFIPLAERNGLIGFLGAWSLRMACHQAAQWETRWSCRLKASVNLSPAQFQKGDIVAVVRQALAESGLSPGDLSLEITEGALMQEPATSETMLTRLRALGVGVAVDDFGTGYSSLAYLKRFPLSVLKIDRSFVMDIENDASGRAIVSVILGLARELGLTVVAEGVETEAQLGMLVDKECDQVQGFLLGRPVSATEFEQRVESGAWKLEKR